MSEEDKDFIKRIIWAIFIIALSIMFAIVCNTWWYVLFAIPLLLIDIGI